MPADSGVAVHPAVGNEPGHGGAPLGAQARRLQPLPDADAQHHVLQVLGVLAQALATHGR